MSHLAEGAALLLRGEVPAAIAALERAVETDGDGCAHHDLALALRAAGELQRALHHAERAVALAPRAPRLALLGSLQWLAARRAAALESFRRALTADPGHALARWCLGLAEGDAALVRAAIPGLPPLLAARAAGQLRELEAGGRLLDDLCSAPLPSEVLGASAAPRTRGEPAGPAGGVARTIDEAELFALLERSRAPLALTGAGLSAASGLRTRKELWREFDRDGAVSIWRFREDPHALWEVVRDFLGPGGQGPNAAHLALAALPLLGVVTQNVDGLHQAAGTRCPVVELHGSLAATRCDGCGARGPACLELVDGPLPPRCACGDALRPDVVLFGEWVAPERLAQALELVARCDLLLVVGTAVDVAPAADLPRLAASRGVPVVEVKRQPSRLHRSLGTLHLPGAAEELLPRVTRGR